MRSDANIIYQTYEQGLEISNVRSLTSGEVAEIEWQPDQQDHVPAEFRWQPDQQEPVQALDTVIPVVDVQEQLALASDPQANHLSVLVWQVPEDQPVQSAEASALIFELGQQAESDRLSMASVSWHSPSTMPPRVSGVQSTISAASGSYNLCQSRRRNGRDNRKD